MKQSDHHRQQDILRIHANLFDQEKFNLTCLLRANQAMKNQLCKSQFFAINKEDLFMSTGNMGTWLPHGAPCILRL